MGWLATRYKQESVQNVHEAIPKERVRRADGRTEDDREIVASHHYFQIWLADLKLENARDKFKAWHPAVYSVVGLEFGSNKPEQISHVAGQSNLDKSIPTGASADVGLNYPLTAVMPFNGGSVEFEAGLVAVPGEDDVKGFLDVLHDFSKLLVVPQLSAALAVAGPLAAGISKLVGASDAHLLLRHHDAWTGIDEEAQPAPDQPGRGNPMRAGYFAVVAADEKQFRKDHLRVKGGRLHFGPDEKKSEALTGYDYMLFRVDRLDTRQDWKYLTTIQEPYQDAIGLLQTAINDAENKDKLLASAKQRLSQAKLAALRSKDLTDIVGRNQVITKLQESFDAALKALGSGAAADSLPTDLDQVLQDLMPPEAAAVLPKIQARDL